MSEKIPLKTRLLLFTSCFAPGVYATVLFVVTCFAIPVALAMLCSWILTGVWVLNVTEPSFAIGGFFVFMMMRMTELSSSMAVTLTETYRSYFQESHKEKSDV